VAGSAGQSYGVCDLCGKPIPFGATSVSLERNVGQAEATAECPDGELTVLDSEELFVFCAECGGLMTAEIVSSLVTPHLAELNGENPRAS
jgi:hypothetical protein